MYIVEEALMLAEIFVLRLETMLRGPEFPARLRNPRFVSFTPDAFPHVREKRAREDGKQI
jgi:hypothetical protein